MHFFNSDKFGAAESDKFTKVAVHAAGPVWAHFL